MINNQVYIGDIIDDTNKISYPDKVIRTPKFKYDTFHTDHFLDVIPGDGDRIVTLESFNEMLLVFKKKTLYIVNTSSEMMFVEEENNSLGVAFPSQVTKSEAGVIWCNKNGVYIYDGSEITNITDNKIKSLWDTFYIESSSNENTPLHQLVQEVLRYYIAPVASGGMGTSDPINDLQWDYVVGVLNNMPIFDSIQEYVDYLYNNFSTGIGYGNFWWYNETWLKWFSGEGFDYMTPPTFEQAIIESQNAGEFADVPMYYNSFKNTQIGYDPQSKHIVIIDKNSQNLYTHVPTNCLIYDTKIEAWSYINNFMDWKQVSPPALADSFNQSDVFLTHSSNFFNSIDNKLIISNNWATISEPFELDIDDFSIPLGSMVCNYTENLSKKRSIVSIKTKDFDFGDPHIRKKVYKIYITYKCTENTMINATYITNSSHINFTDESFSSEESNSTVYHFKTGTNYIEGIPSELLEAFESSDLDIPTPNFRILKRTGGEWRRAELKPETSSEANNIYSFQLHLQSLGKIWNQVEGGEVPSDFEINDISIVYRIKGIR